MHKTSIVSATAALLALAGVCFAQPPGITREMIETALPVEGAPRAEPGPYAVTSEAAFGSPGYLVFRPTNLDAFPAKDTLPVMVWGNGGCAIDSTRWSGFLTTIASHGFLVMGTAAQQDAPRRQATADDLRAAIDWAEKENTRTGSPLNGKIATNKVAVMGQSCGGFLSIGLGGDPRVGTIGVFNSGVQRANPGAPPSPFPTADALPKLHGPVLLINGHERDFMMAASAATACRCSTALGTMPGTRQRSFTPVAASLPTSRRTGSGGPSREIRKPPRCSSARTAASARIRIGTSNRRV
jgi:dienelactone hydrolase